MGTDLVHPHDPTAECDAERGRRDRGVAPRVDLEIEQLAEEGLVRRGKEQRVPESGETVGGPQQGQRLVGGLAEVEPGVEHDPLRRNTGGFGLAAALEKEGGDLLDDVVVDRFGVGHPGTEPDVGRDHRRTGDRGRAAGSRGRRSR